MNVKSNANMDAMDREKFDVYQINGFSEDDLRTANCENNVGRLAPSLDTNTSSQIITDTRPIPSQQADKSLKYRNVINLPIPTENIEFRHNTQDPGFSKSFYGKTLPSNVSYF